MKYNIYNACFSPKEQKEIKMLRETIVRAMLTKSFKLYLIIFGFNVLLVILGLFVFTRSADIGILFGSSLGAIDLRFNPFYLPVVIPIYFIRRPFIAIIATIVFSFIHQALTREGINEQRQIMGLAPVGFINFPIMYGGILFLSMMGVVHCAASRILKRQPQ
jgi:hypothetical protein